MYIYVYSLSLFFVGNTVTDVVEACHRVHDFDSEYHTDRLVRHKRMACWFHLFLCMYSLPALAMFAATAANTQVVESHQYE